MNVAEIFENMEWGPAPEARDEADAWLESHGRAFGHFIGGKRDKPGETFATVNPANGEELAQVTQGTEADVARAVEAARKAQPAWEKLDDHDRARVLYAIARGLQKHARLFAVLETLDTGKPIREARDIDVALAARHFYHHAGHAELRGELVPGRMPWGVCGQIVPWNFPLLMLAWKVAPALAMGNSVVLKPAEWTPLTALAFADICETAGVPPGVVNIVTGDGATGAALARAEIDKLAFTGSTEVGRTLRRETAGRGIGLTLELGGKSPYIVFEDADIDGAVEGLVDAIWFNGGQVCCAGARLLIQEGISEEFLSRLKTRMGKIRVGDPLDKSVDMGAMVHSEHKARVEALLAQTAGEVHRGTAPDGCFLPPTLVSGLHSADPLMQEEVFGPVLAATTFRTPAEAVQLANDTSYGLAGSVWSQDLDHALDIAPRIDAGVVWVNGANMLDAAAPFGGMKESGFGREGGVAGLSAYLRPEQGSKLKAPRTHQAGPAPTDAVDRTAKLYIGGKQARPDGGYTRPVAGPKGMVGEVGIANRKDVRNAVEAASGARGWSGTTAHLRAQILYYLAENLSARADEFDTRLAAQTGGKPEAAQAVRHLFRWAAWADKHDGRVVGVPMGGLALALNRPVGVIGAFAPEEAPLIGLAQIIGATLATGNRLVLVAPETAPLTATDLYQVLDTSDVPAGVVNILTGDHAELAPHLAGHAGIGACWSFSSADISGLVEREAASALTRTWVNNGHSRDWAGRDAAPWLEAATEIQTVWIPFGL
ncbi:aldehyde dehydrogenase family protein [Jannaschia aquimarina]|uniref:AldA protein n=1 Tax=Jannaschia aquimarina TaxID=935700 RepID=A0A0D1EFN4_9RHOB|nr:aldehyde dehydrogenase family protein [Jannaschia aquimarina]KIT16484.1 putative aldehyde dehydrogenase AldA [Jannaschia aquimarina]SNT07457.1 aldehyde dehydrogenase (NAD+) [Jannaschia aquimarina]